MPKIYLTETQKENEIIKQNLVLLQGRLSCEQMGRILGVSKSTYLNRLKSPAQLTVRELKKICKHFNISANSFLTERLTYQ